MPKTLAHPLLAPPNFGPSLDASASSSDPSTPARYGTEAQAAAELGLSPGTLRTWRSRRVGPSCWRKFGRVVRYDMPALRAWADAQRGPDAMPAPCAA